MAVPGTAATAARAGGDRRDHGFHPLRVREVVRETEDACSLVLDVPGELREAFAYRAGQFLTFRVRRNGATHLRSYSMSTSPEVDADLRVTVKRVPGGAVSAWVVDELAAGDVVESTCPAGHFCLSEATGDVVAFAGGSGITPVFSLLKSALATTQRRVRLLYANRDRGSVIFGGVLDGLAAEAPDRLEVVHHLDDEGGFVQADAIRRLLSAPDADYYVCGPGPFMALVEQTLLAEGVEASRIHIERFTPAEPLAEVPPETPVADAPQPAAATQVTIELDGQTVSTAHRPGVSLLQTARQAGLRPPFSCEAGDCATCMAKLVEGSATMRANNALTDDEVAEGWVLTCQAVPTSASVHVVYEGS